MKGSEMLSKNTSDELHGILERVLVTHTQSGIAPHAAAGQEFCKIWPQAKPILEGVSPLLGFIPGYGVAAAAALHGLLEVGQHVFDQSCGAKPLAAAE
jgi:hypothetical protein